MSGPRALFGPDAPVSGCLFVEVKRTSLSRWQSSDASLQRDLVTPAPADDCALRMNRYPPIGASDEPTEATRFDSTAWAARVFGVRTKAAITGHQGARYEAGRQP
jgi:hypothetical protein